MSLDVNDVREMLKSNFVQLEKNTRHLLNMKVFHNSTDGSNREGIYANVIRHFISDKYEIAQNVFIIDSEGKISKEVDIVIYEKTYIPYIFKKENIKILPIEGVFAAIQSKSDIKNVKEEDLKNWVESVESLTSKSGVYSGSIFQLIGEPIIKKRDYKPLMILMAIDNRVDKSKLKDGTCEKIFDYTIFFKKENVTVLENIESIEDKLKGIIDGEKKHEIYNWFSKKEVKKDLIYFYFQLNKYLILINNPHPFPLDKYEYFMYNENK